jgi:hypothetical protein
MEQRNDAHHKRRGWKEPAYAGLKQKHTQAGQKSSLIDDRARQERGLSPHGGSEDPKSGGLA